MLSRDESVPDFVRSVSEGDARSSTNIKMLLIAVAFLFVTIGLLLIIPDEPSSTPIQVAETSPVVIEAEVSRADASLLELDIPAAEAVSRQLRQPIRLTDSNDNRNDLNKMTTAVLVDFGYVPPQGDRLQNLLVQALSEGQSNAYIDALLNTAAARGEFTPPRQLLLRSGRMDTQALLKALVRSVQNQG
ncbi:hypothetical protein [Tateyamaria sp.]